MTIAIVALVAVAVFALADSSPVREAHAQLPLGDIVFIVDESSSMGADIADVRNNVNNIANQLGASVDFQLGLVGFGDGTHFGAPFSGAAHIHQALTSDVPTFQNAVNQLVASGGFEPGFSATVLGMSDPMGFRQGAGVCSIIITDEDADISPSAPETKADALAALNSRGAVFLGIVDLNSGNTAADYGPSVGSLSEATGGQVFDLIAFRADPQPVLDAIIAECIESILEPQFIEVPVDIKPTSCRNPLRADGRGVLPVAILGTDDFDVTQVDVSTVALEGVSPLRSSLRDVATPFEPFTGKVDAFDCTDEGPDGFLDLTLKFDTQEVIAALGPVADGDVLVLQLTANLLDGTPIVGEDVVVILDR